MIKILSTKILSKNLVKKIKKNNLEFFEHNFLKISYKKLENKNINLLQENNNLIFIFTSKYALENIKKIKIKNKKCFAIEWKTSELAKKNWFEILGVWKNSLDLAEKINNSLLELKNKTLIHLTTENHLKDMEDFLKKKWIILETINVYEKKLNPKKIDFQFDAILFFSPSSIDSFFIKNNLEKKVIIFCIWETTKKYLLEKKLKNKIIISKKSSIKNLVEEIFNYYK